MTAAANLSPEYRGSIVDTAMVRFLGERRIVGSSDLPMLETDTTLAVAMSPAAIATFTLPLPAAVSDIPGAARYRFYDALGQAGSYNILINASGGALIDGQTQLAIVGDWGGVVIEWRGTYWHAESTFNVMALGGVFGVDGPDIPVVPDSEEFNGPAVPTQVSLLSTATVDTVPPARGQAFTGPDLVRVSLTQRQGWLMFQPSSDTPGVYFNRPLNTALINGLLYTKFSMDSNGNIASSDIFQFGFAQTTLLGSELIPDFNNMVIISLARDTSDNSWNVFSSSKVAGVGTTIYDKVLDSFTQPFTRMAIGKVGTEFTVYVGSESGGFKALASVTSVITPDRWFIGASNSIDPACVYGIDYVRRVDGIYPTV